MCRGDGLWVTTQPSGSSAQPPEPRPPPHPPPPSQSYFYQAYKRAIWASITRTSLSSLDKVSRSPAAANVSLEPGEALPGGGWAGEGEGGWDWDGEELWGGCHSGGLETQT